MPDNLNFKISIRKEKIKESYDVKGDDLILH